MTARFGEFKLAKLKTLRGHENEAFEAELTLYGKTVAYVSNTGTGGSHTWHWMPNTKTIEELFHTLAVAACEVDFEVDDSLVWDLIEATKLARKKSLLILLPEDGDFWVDGQYRTTNATREQVLAENPDAKFFNKEILDFV